MELIALLEGAQRVVISTHLRPDGDAIGSQLALGRFLKKQGKRVSLVNADPAPLNLDWLPGIDDIGLFTGSVRQLEDIARADALISVDVNQAARLGDVGASFRGAPGKKLLIDHHPGPEDWFDAQYVRQAASSTGELVFDLIEQMDLAALDTETALALYTAVVTDTGSFRFSNVTPRLHRIVAELLERGSFAPDPVHENIYDRRSLNSIRFLGRVLERIVLDYDGQLGYVTIPRDLLTGAGVEKGDTEGIVNYVLSIEGVRVALFFLEVERGTKISFRSKGDWSVTEWATALGGGGHRNASGAFIRKPLDYVVRRTLEQAPKYLNLASDEDREGSGDLSDDDTAYLNELLKTKSR